MPDAPVSLLDNSVVTSDSVAAFTWSDGVSHGGAPIIDYKIEYDQSIGEFVTLEEGVVPQSY